MHRDAAALRGNARIVRTLAPGRRIWAVIKAEAYGHGMIWAAQALAAEVDGFAVSCLEEAVALREAGIAGPLLVLQGPRRREDWALCAHHAVQPVLHEEAQLAELQAFSGHLPGLWIKLDTGMHRLGFAPERARALFEQLRSHPAARQGLHWMTHLACADRPGHPQNRSQLKAFTAAVAGLPGLRSLGNSAAIAAGLAGAPREDAAEEWVRPGIMLYGVNPLDAAAAGAVQGLRPVMTVQAPLIAVKTAEPGAGIGYGATWTTLRTTRVGVVAMGYADGYPRHAPSGTPVLVHGRECPLIGRVSMDMLKIDLNAVPEARVGDPVTLWGEGLPVERIAHAAGTISYELLTRVAGRLHIVDP
jgi:alanine racemase